MYDFISVKLSQVIVELLCAYILPQMFLDSHICERQPIAAKLCHMIGIWLESLDKVRKCVTLSGLATVMQVLQDLFKFYCMFYFTCDRSLSVCGRVSFISR